MSKMTLRCEKLMSIKLIGIFLICVSVFLSQRFSISSIWGQVAEPTSNGSEKQMEKEEKSWVEVLRNKKEQSKHPEKVLKAIDELGNIARLRGISSTNTMNVLAEYLDVHKDSWAPPSNKAFNPPEIVFQPHPMLREASYPAVVAFQQIRRPAVPVMAQVIENSKIGSLKSNNALFVIKYNFREALVEAADYLREQAELAKSEEGRQRLLNAAVEVLRPNH